MLAETANVAFSFIIFTAGSQRVLFLRPFLSSCKPNIPVKMVIVSSLCRHGDAFAECRVLLAQRSKVQGDSEPMAFIIFGRRRLQGWLRHGSLSCK